MDAQAWKRRPEAPNDSVPDERRPQRPDSCLVRRQLERILESSEFPGSKRTRRFLRYVVEETLAGRGDRIKAFSVALAAFDRDENFNAQTDPIVRIEAGRLRRGLERYYLVAGTADEVRIEIPKGSYVPLFSWVDGQPSQSPSERATGTAVEASVEASVGRPASPVVRRFFSLPAAMLLIVSVVVLAAGLIVLVLDRGQVGTALEAGRRPDLPQPSIAVLPFRVVDMGQSDADLSVGMTNEIVRELSRHGAVFVIGPRSLQRFGPAPDVMIVGEQAGVAFVLSGDIQHIEDRIQVAVQLSETRGGSVIWAETFERAFGVAGLFDLQAQVGREIVRKVVQPQGAIALFDWKRTRGMAPESWEAYDCVVQANELHRRGEPPAQTGDIRACLQRAVVQEPGYADPWVMLALLEIDAVRFSSQTQVSSETLEAAYTAAKRGVDLAPDSGWAHMALMLTLSFRGETERALAAGNVALRLSPEDPDILGEVGLRQVTMGSVDTGIELLEHAAALFEDMPLSHRLALSLGYLRKGLSQKASDLVANIGPTANYVYWSVAAAAYGKAGRLDAARLAVRELLTLYPDFAARAWAELQRRHVAADLAAILVEGWQAAGLAVAQPADSSASR